MFKLARRETIACASDVNQNTIRNEAEKKREEKNDLKLSDSVRNRIIEETKKSERARAKCKERPNVKSRFV